MRKQKRDDTKGKKAVEAYGIKPINEECKVCTYYKRDICKGQFCQTVPCIYAKVEG